MIVFWALWSILVWSFSFLVMLAIPIASIPFLLFLPFERFQRWFPVQIMAFIPSLTLSSIRMRYHERFDRKRVSMFICNHTSMMDAHMVLRIIPQVFCGIMNAAHLRVPGYGWIMKLANVVPVERNKEGQAAIMAEMVKERASRNISIIAFPEAHRTLDGKLRPFKRGVFFMARDAGVPVVPVAIRGLYEVFPKGTWIMRPGKIDVWVGPQVETAGLSDAQVNELVQRVRQYILSWVEQGEMPTDEVLRVGADAAPDTKPLPPAPPPGPADARADGMTAQQTGEPAPSM